MIVAGELAAAYEFAKPVPDARTLLGVEYPDTHRVGKPTYTTPITPQTGSMVGTTS
jgi:hypothetical protein